METKKITRILIIDKNRVDYLKIQQMIHAIPENHFQIDWCDDIALGIKKICDQLYDMYFIALHIKAYSLTNYENTCFT